ncbi:MAG: FAD-linked oxidase C-terminal domain-containing protein [Akkermansia sp.]
MRIREESPGGRLCGQAVPLRWVHGGAITGEHVIGLAKAKGFREAVGEGAFHLHELVKSALDPGNLLNPGKMGLP